MGDDVTIPARWVLAAMWFLAGGAVLLTARDILNGLREPTEILGALAVVGSAVAMEWKVGR